MNEALKKLKENLNNPNFGSWEKELIKKVLSTVTNYLQPFHLYQTVNDNDQTLFIFKEIAFHDDGSGGGRDLVPFYIEGLVIAEEDIQPSWETKGACPAVSFFSRHIIDIVFEFKAVSIHELPLYIGWKYKSDIFERLLKGESPEAMIKSMWNRRD